jgi:hypothetical protein
VARHPANRRGLRSSTRARELPCGCVFYDGQNLPTFTCREFTALETVKGFTDALAAAAPAEPFFRQLAEVTRTALARDVDGSSRPQPASEAA